MKLITLNIWGGHVLEPLLTFIKAYQDVDIFCLQEIYHNAKEKISTDDREVDLDVFSLIQNCLPDHQGFFRPVVNDIYGIGMFVNKNINILGEGDVLIHENPNYAGIGPAHTRNLQWLICHVGNRMVTILNIHGLWNDKGKDDCLERLAQSKQIKAFMDSLNTPKILCGDFNLKPDTESLSLLETDMTNLIKKYHVTSTRTSFYPKEERFADYILVSSDISVSKFAVLDEEVSDHSPLLLAF